MWRWGLHVSGGNYLQAFSNYFLTMSSNQDFRAATKKNFKTRHSDMCRVRTLAFSICWSEFWGDFPTNVVHTLFEPIFGIYCHLRPQNSILRNQLTVSSNKTKCYTSLLCSTPENLQYCQMFHLDFKNYNKTLQNEQLCQPQCTLGVWNCSFILKDIITLQSICPVKNITLCTGWPSRKKQEDCPNQSFGHCAISVRIWTENHSCLLHSHVYLLCFKLTQRNGRECSCLLPQGRSFVHLIQYLCWGIDGETWVVQRWISRNAGWGCSWVISTQARRGCVASWFSVPDVIVWIQVAPLGADHIAV